ncbi:hypothetical protein BDZ45DRAFT_485788 [Acephala macrosclerotiorum]|nr:hypothetical protein BDZ45DRAFT_485788 [Acephala macrosclerotiorum]
MNLRRRQSPASLCCHAGFTTVDADIKVAQLEYRHATPGGRSPAHMWAIAGLDVTSCMHMPSLRRDSQTMLAGVSRWRLSWCAPCLESHEMATVLCSVKVVSLLMCAETYDDFRCINEV